MTLENAQDLSSVLNYDELLTRCLNRLDFAERMLDLFQTRSAEELADVEQAAERGDIEQVRRIAHRLAGAAANAAAFGVQQRAAELRIAATSGSAVDVQQRIADLRHEWQRVDAAISASRCPVSTN
jgi:HPt (histidine-containing phosphotransfer) domain-containing protein